MRKRKENKKKTVKRISRILSSLLKPKKKQEEKKKTSSSSKATLKSKKSPVSKKTPSKEVSLKTPPTTKSLESSLPKFDLGIDLKEEAQPVKLPQRYFDNKIVALTRDPWWVHTYWDISPQKEAEVLSKISSQEKPFLKKILRVYDVTEVKDINNFSKCQFFDVEINSLATNWYINVNKPGRSFCIEIGYLTSQGEFFVLARSNIIKTPRFGISEELDEEWVLPEDEYYKILGVYDLGKSSLQRMRALKLALERGISSGGASGLFSPLLRKRVKKGFFFEVYTELIIYGRTHPQANLTLKGEKVNLQEDGTFSLRFHLPLGKFEFPFRAVSPSQDEKIEITPIVERTEK
ncbi:MAG: hypothetical protein DRP61_04205 [Candidatus Omnitrophota bacterium]|nr:MAG: hypothetical protein DRP61_04205 [Candidatus Omnitrophota bacterium]RKY34796.1 MAG: hypothetical protein DRP69_03645 [Candidatus Omnitrophota bacterium]RKY44915.1 MAG: hypothetical protein DRP80_00970 [Candidatus Omnitrophota bacterium]